METTSNPTTTRSERRRPPGRFARRHLFRSVGLGLALVFAASACTQPADLEGASTEELGCDNLPTGDGGEAVVLLGDGTSPSLTQALELLHQRPGQVFAALGADAEPAEGADGGEEQESGIVVLATYDEAGSTTVHGDFDLRGVADESRRRRADAERQDECLERASEGVGPAPVRPELTDADAEPSQEAPPLGSTTSLLRALAPAAAQARAAAGPDSPATVVVTGMSRSLIEGYPLAGIDLSTDGRATLFGRMADSELPLPNLAEHDVDVVFLDPTEGVDSAIAAGGIESFATDLCERIEASSCAIRSVLG